MTDTATSPSPRPAAARPSAHPVPGRRLPGALPGARLQARTAPRGALAIESAPRTRSLAHVSRHKRTLVVTYRRDGTAVPTPVWAAQADGLLYVRSERAAGKVKRLRRDPRLLLAPCTVRGRPLGAPLEATARVLAGEEELRAERTLAGRYGLGRALFERAVDAMRVDMCYLEITPGAWDAQEAPAAAIRAAG
ncbi:MAG TPA: PPOX class F420-dependent oxidoreductase [Solirubrobacteraceae bacterium]|nr:PPOX class F420-dependent oxidoreductase [Solirubrobacteraceae bacterium]